MVEFSDSATGKQSVDQGRQSVLQEHQCSASESPTFSKVVKPEEEASKIIDLAKTRLDTMDSLFTTNASRAGLLAAKALADEVARLTPAQIADVNNAMIAQYRNMYPNFKPVPSGLVNDQGQAVGMEIRASSLDFWPGPHSLQILDDGKMVTVRREVAPGRVENGRQLPPVYIVDAQAVRKK